SKLQIGSPMASLYLLGNPDHYTNMTFKVFWWKSYISLVKRDFISDEAINSEDYEDPADGTEPQAVDETDKVVLMKGQTGYVGTTPTDDYIMRPKVLEDVCLFDFIQMTQRKKRTPAQ
ncbi:hypothetical protein R3P38DRAFT_2370624, partial [Favolaschia claudopus]